MNSNKQLKILEQIAQFEGLLETANPEQVKVLQDTIRSKQRQLKLYDSAVVVVADDMSVDEFNDKRCHSAVSYRGRTYLPHQKKGFVIFPNVFLRSALFSSTVEYGEVNTDGDGYATIASNSDITLKLKGHLLDGTDRKVFGCCLLQYANEPLAAKQTNNGYQTMTFYKFAQDLGFAYGPGVHAAIRNSLMRLSEANIRVIDSKGRNRSLPRLIECEFVDYKALDRKPLGSDKLSIRVSEQVAELFGLGDWSAIPKEALAYKGLPGWFAAYLSSHDSLIPLSLNHIQKISGATEDAPIFRRQTKNAMKVLSQPDVHDKIRVMANASIDKKTGKLLVTKVV